MRTRTRMAAAAAMAAVVAGAATATAAVQHAGPQGDGTGMTPNGWRLTPAGRQVDLADATWWADRPLASSLSPDGRWLLVSSDGQSKQSLKLVDTASGAVRQTIAYTAPEALFVGLAWSPDGKHAYAAAGGNNKVRQYTFANGTLTEGAALPVAGYPAGLTLTADGSTLLVAQNRADALGIVDLRTGTASSVPLGACTEGGGPVNFPTSAGASAPQCQPFGVTLSPDQKTAYVSNWGEHSLSVVSLPARTAGPHIPVGTHPIALATNPVSAKHEVYVANGDSDSVSVIDTVRNAVSRTISLAPYEGAPVGTNPDSLAVTADGRTLYVANGGNNDVAAVDLAGEEPQVRGLIPTAWYPTSVALGHDGKSLFVTNAKGLGAGPNPGYRQGQYGPPSQYVGSMTHGTLSIIPVPEGGALERYTQQVRRNNHAGEGDENGEGEVVPHLGGTSPIKHVIYVVKENRTYDQVFGSLGRGNGDPNLNLFGDESAPNIRNLARQFVTLDNFYASAEVSADGWNWSTAANANGYVQRTWPANYSDVNRGRGYDFEGGNYATAPGRDPRNSYLWDSLAARGVDFRNYGFWTVFGASPSVPQPTAPNLKGRTSPTYPGYNLAIADSPCGPSALTHPSRFSDWQSEFKQYEANGNLPAFEFVRLPNDHTRGTTPGAETPRRYVADNDYAVGRLVESVSHSRFWSSTAIFVVEDDAQDGPDHVDAHRTEALVISPYTQTGKVDSTLYSTVSMLRTMELIVGLKPMTQFDAAATPMLNAFSRKPSSRAFSATVPEVLKPTPPDPDCPSGQAGRASGASTNTPRSPMAAQSAQMDFSTADSADPRQLNQAIWQSVKGGGSQMPAPRSATGTGRDND